MWLRAAKNLLINLRDNKVFILSKKVNVSERCVENFYHNFNILFKLLLCVTQHYEVGTMSILK